jgi:hypothetical protein
MSARWLASTLLLATCGSDGISVKDAAQCGRGIDQPPLEGAMHVYPPTTVDYAANPPASGNHWPTPAPWGVASAPIDREQWVHNLEHGGVVLLYNCPSGCDADVAALTALRNRPADQFHEVRILVTPDATMPKKLAAVAWGWRWQGDSFDQAAVKCFIDARYDKGAESIP